MMRNKVNAITQSAGITAPCFIISLTPSISPKPFMSDMSVESEIQECVNLHQLLGKSGCSLQSPKEIIMEEEMYDEMCCYSLVKI